MTADLMSASESRYEAKPMGPDIDKYPRIAAALCDLPGSVAQLTTVHLM